MTPVRAVFASLFAATIFGAGVFIAASLAGGRPHDLVPLLFVDRTPFSIWCFLAAWGAILVGVLGVLAAFLAFIAPEEEDEPRFRRRGFPKAAPLVLIAVALGLVWIALRCASAASSAPIAVAIEPEADASRPEPELLGGGPEPEPVSAEPAAPRPLAEATSFQWPYMDPLMRSSGAIRISGREPFADDDAENRRLLCGKAWVAVTGSSSEEGPPERNAARARARTEYALLRANSWVYDHDQCGPTLVFGVDLGQHQPTGGDGDATAYQRQILVISRLRTEGESLTFLEARAELQQFLGDPEQRAALYAGRVFTREPAIVPSPES